MTKHYCENSKRLKSVKYFCIKAHYRCLAGPYKWVKVLKNGPSKIFGRLPSRNLKGYGLPK